MAIDSGIYRGIDTQFGQKLADLLNPASIRQRQMAEEEQNMGNQLRQMQVLQGVEQMRRAPVLAQRENQQWQAQQAEAQRLQQERAQREQAMAQLPEDQRRLLQVGVSPNTVFSQEKPAAIIQEMRAAGISETSPEGQKILRQRLMKPEGVADAQRGQIVFDNQGRAFNVNPYTNEVRPVKMGDTQIQGAQYSPDLQGQIAGAKSFSGTVEGDRAKSIADAPRVIDNANEAIRLTDALLNHPGMKQAVGASSMFGLQKVPGTQAKDFMNRLDQVKGGAFLEAFNALKGGGQITEVEGKKATDAIARMDNATSEEAFKQAVEDYQSVIRIGVERAKRKAGGAQSSVSTQSGASGQWGIQRVK